MNEKKSPDEEPIEDSFNEDFDFGEGETETHPIQTSPKPGLNKKIVGGIFIVIFVVILIMGYRIFRSSTPPKPTSLVVKETVPPTPMVQTAPTAPTVTTKPTTAIEGAAPSPSSPEQNFGEIAEAFSNQKANAAEGSIQELQKELFAPEPPQPAHMVNAPQAPVPTEAETSQLARGLTKLNQQIDYILGQIKHLDSYSQEVSENLNKLNDAINVMDNRLSALTNTTSTLSKDVGSVKNEVGHVKQVLKEDGLDINLGSISEKKYTGERNSTITIEGPEYIVHAVIPGRAWLKSAKGQIITVAEGDTIGNYGKILVIDAVNGVVLTSSGVAFR